MSVESRSITKGLSVPRPNQVPNGYFRSKLFSTSSTNNPLVAAASPLLSLLERLCVSPTLPPIEQMRENIEHELFAFNSRLSCQQYVEEFVTIAHYLLYATIDELLGKNYMRLYGEHAEFKAFTPSTVNEVGPEYQFFIIINYLKERATQYLDLIELAYYCLIAGFEGEHHVRADGRQLLDNLIEELHQLILQHRANKPHQLFKEQYERLPEASRYKPLILVSFIAICVLTCTYLGSNTLLERQAKAVLFKKTQYAQMDN
ncbi:MAG: type IVB secretion system protein IcmH/DotU [Legionellaceae bacterium]|nr:type IVB secretion system protein IcmH/DotU [Legionellaceae bacterium]